MCWQTTSISFTSVHTGQIADGLAAANGNLEKLTIKEVDSVITGPLVSGKAEVKALRKKLIQVGGKWFETSVKW